MIYLDYETTGLRQYHRDFRILGASIAVDDEHPKFYRDEKAIRHYLERDDRIIVFNLAYERGATLAAYGIDILDRTDDVMMMARCLGYRGGLKDIANDLLGARWGDTLDAFRRRGKEVLAYMRTKRRLPVCLEALRSGGIPALLEAWPDAAGISRKALYAGDETRRHRHETLGAFLSTVRPEGADMLIRNIEAGTTDFGFDGIPDRMLAKYAVGDVIHTRGLHRRFERELETARLRKTYETVYLPQVKLAAVMEQAGIAWDEPMASYLEGVYADQRERAVESWNGMVGHDGAKINSPTKYRPELNRIVLTERMRVVRILAAAKAHRSPAFPNPLADFSAQPWAALDEWTLPRIEKEITTEDEYSLFHEFVQDYDRWDDDQILDLHACLVKVLGFDVDDREQRSRLPEIRAAIFFRMAKKIAKIESSFLGPKAKIGRGSIAWFDESWPPNVREPGISHDTYDCATNILETSFNPAAADTKRWRAQSHTTPADSDVVNTWTSRWRDGVLFHLDFRQMEVRVAAGLSGDDALLGVFASGRDPHRMVISRVLGIPEDKVSPAQRSASKFLTFAMAYGQSTKMFADNHLDGDFRAAKDLISRFWTEFPKFWDWTVEQRRAALEFRPVTTLWGDPLDIGMPEDAANLSPAQRGRLSRREWIGDDIGRQLNLDINSAMRRCVNYPIQATASHLAALAAWHLHRKVEGRDIRVINFTHDSIDLDLRWGEVERLLSKLRRWVVGYSRKLCGGWPLDIDAEIGVAGNRRVEISGKRLTGNRDDLRALESVAGASFRIRKTGKRRTPLSNLFLPKFAWTSTLGLPSTTAKGKFPW